MLDLAPCLLIKSQSKSDLYHLAVVAGEELTTLHVEDESRMMCMVDGEERSPLEDQWGHRSEAIAGFYC